MKIKIQILEGFYTTIWKEPIEIETEDYPELKDMTKEQAIEYIRDNSDDIQLRQEGLEMEWSLYDELMDQDTELEREKNYETNIVEWTP
jgi:hypothetical protein